MPSVDSQGLTLHYSVRGEGTPLLLMHSFLCSGAMWGPQLEALAAGYRVINLDLRGHGASGPVDRAFSLYDMVADALRVLDAEGVERAVWCGLSIGGMISMRAALEFPERVSALVLLDTDAGPESAAVNRQYAAMSFVVGRFGPKPLLSRIAGLMFGATTLREQAPLVAEWKQRWTGVHVPSMQRTLSALSGRDSLLPRLGRVVQPTLVIHGVEDRALPMSRGRRIAEAIPNAQLVEISEAGHLSTLEQPVWVNSAMLDFLETDC